MPTVLLYWSPGRTDEQKAQVVHHITETLVEYGGANRSDVLIIFQEIAPGNAARGGEIIGFSDNDVEIVAEPEYTRKPRIP